MGGERELPFIRNGLDLFDLFRGPGYCFTNKRNILHCSRWRDIYVSKDDDMLTHDMNTSRTVNPNLFL